MFKTKERFLGVDISPSAVKVMEISRKGKRLQIEACAIESLPEGIFEDYKPNDIEQVATALKQAVKNSGTRLRKAAVAMPTAGVIMRTVAMPSEYDETAIEDTMEVDAAQYIPFPIDDIYMDFEPRGASRTGRDYQDVMLVAARRELVDLRREVLEEAGLKCIIVDVETYALENAFRLLSSELYFAGDDLTDENITRLNTIHTAMVDVGAQVSSLYVLQGDRVVFNRDQPIGCAVLTQAIADTYDMSRDQALLAQRSSDLPADYEAAVLGPFRQSVAEQISSALQFYYSSGNYSSIDSIVLVGGGGMIEGLDRVLSDRVGVPATVCNPFSTFTTAKRVNRHGLMRDAPLYGIACGLAMRSLDR